MKPEIGITATLPVEIIFAAGFKPVDLNNLFIGSENAAELIGQAESAGFAHNICAWIKGIYATVLDRDIKTIVAVTGGDCSNTIALGEVLARRGVEVIPFEYPLNRDREVLAAQMDRLRERLSASWRDIESVKRKLDKIRRKLNQLDLLSYSGNVVSGLENHLFLVGSSDFSGDPEAFEEKLDRFLQTVQTRNPRRDEVRLGYLGVPPIFAGFYEFIESLGGRVVFNEVQRQFSMPALRTQLVDQYLEYTYPYAMGGRLQDILGAVETRRLDGLIHYTQTFCYRQIYDLLLRESAPVPVLTLEGDRPGQLDSRTAFRIETFLEMLSARKFG